MAKGRGSSKFKIFLLLMMILKGVGIGMEVMIVLWVSSGQYDLDYCFNAELCEIVLNEIWMYEL